MGTLTRRAVLAAVPGLGLIVPSAYAKAGNEGAYSQAMQAKIDEMTAELKKYKDERAIVGKNLETFDTLDFVVFSNQEWVRLHESHSLEVVVNWPDGHHTNGIERHIEDLKAMFVYAPDTKIKVHPIKFGSNDFTCVTGIMSGSFTRPMPIGNGKFIQPTGKSFALPMCTVGHWKDGVMMEEWLYWDGSTYMKQMGVGS
jgi:hypothetical protein